MLPPILEVAEKLNIQFDERTLEKEEVRAKCPFCKEDSNKEKKFYLSLNTEKNVFKCWYCSKSGGVLHFESLVSGKPFSEVREKYFGNQKSQNTHPAYNLSPQQLKEIGWYGVKRNDFKSFLKNKENIFKDWEIYKYEELAKYYAVFILIAHYPKPNERRELYSQFIELTALSKVDNLRSLIEVEYKNGEKKRWARRGKDIARMAYRYSMTNDSDFENLFSNVLFVIEVMKIKNRLKNRQNQKMSV